MGPSWQALFAHLRDEALTSNDPDPTPHHQRYAVLSPVINSFIRTDGAIAADYTNYYWTRGNVQLPRHERWFGLGGGSLFDGIQTVFTVGHVLRTRDEFSDSAGSQVTQDLWDYIASFFHCAWFLVRFFPYVYACRVSKMLIFHCNF